MAPRQTVVIVGAGFGGLWAARTLARGLARGAPRRRPRLAGVRVVIIDRHNYHTFLPLLYQVAAAELEPDDIAYPVRGILRSYPPVEFLMRQVTDIDVARRAVITADSPGEAPVTYDYLILAAGSRTNFFGLDSVARHAFELKDISQAVALRSHILRQFERAAGEDDRAARRALLTFVIVGGGPTGIEFAGALAELVRGVLVKDYRRLDLADVRIVLVEATGRLLPALAPELAAYAERRLAAMGVEVRTHAVVTGATPDEVRFKDGSVIRAHTLVWTAGVRASELAERLAGQGPGGRVVVEATLQLPGHPEVYCVGDMAHVVPAVAASGPPGSERPLPQVAPVAIQQGEHAARNILRQLEGLPPLPFHYRDRGTMVTIGRSSAVAVIGRRKVRGFVAWLAWLGVHLIHLIGFRNRLLVLVNWAWSYLFFDRGVRLISAEESSG